ncbi:hypothetical protein Rs2_19774 [Raphanus sativus]|nr:hypothetical protein Rs2_19774 [Raphanus sativus]
MGRRKKRILSSLPASLKFSRYAVAASRAKSARAGAAKAKLPVKSSAAAVDDKTADPSFSRPLGGAELSSDSKLSGNNVLTVASNSKEIDDKVVGSLIRQDISATHVEGSTGSGEKSPISPSEEATVNVAGNSTSEDNRSPTPKGGPKYSEVLHRSTLLEELGTPTQHISGAPFVLIPDENVEEAKEEFKDFLFARFHGDAPDMGRIIGIVNAIWNRSGPRIFVHRLSPLTFLLRVSSPRTRTLVLARSVWIIAGYPMYVAPWAPEFSPEEPQLSTAVVPVELRGVPYLLFNNQSLSRLATAIGKPVSVAPETERKENFEVAKLWVKVDLLADLPSRIVSGFSNGREVEIFVTYPWLPIKCEACGKYGHEIKRCGLHIPDPPRETARPSHKTKRSNSKKPKARNHPRSGRSPSIRERTIPPDAKSGDNSPLLDTPDLDREKLEDGIILKDPDGAGTHTVNEVAADAGTCTIQTVEADPASPALEKSGDSGKEECNHPGDSGIKTPSQIFSLDRGGYTSTVIVTHSGGSSGSDLKAQQDNEASSPFFLVNNRKSGRKVTRH